LTYATEQQLKSFLDSNPLKRERLCLAILALDKRFTEVHPRHPRGGRDGGIDIDAIFKPEQRAAGAVGFVNGANDSRDQKNRIKAKFKKDARSAIANEKKPSVFVFFTNLDLTIKEKSTLKVKAQEIGFAECDIFDRERLRVVLDSVDGFVARIQYLDITLSDAEQVSFFARWGDDIESVISTSFQRVERTLDRLLFLQEADYVLNELNMVYELDRIYDADEIGHFRLFCSLLLHEAKLNIAQIFFGQSDRSDRSYDHPTPPDPEHAGIGHGICGGQWENYTDVNRRRRKDTTSSAEKEEKWALVAGARSIGMEEISYLNATYSHDTSFLRFQPRMLLRDIDGCSFIHYLNASLATKVKAIHVYANGYKLAEYGPENISIDPSSFDHEIPPKFAEQELTDPWVRIRGKTDSMHSMDFFSWTPKRFFTHREITDTLDRTKNKWSR
jgi:hypothetical protein